MQTILGAGGAIGNELVNQFTANNESFRLVGRNPKPAGNAQLKSADLTDSKAVEEAVQGSSVVYLLAGLQYNIHIWGEQWPKIMTNVIESCKKAKAKLIFFDNVYMYGLVEGAMTENTPYNPISKKGEVRAKIATQLMDEVKKGNLHATIARAADFYGPIHDKSILGVMVFQNLAKGSRAQWLVNDHVPHSYTFTPDAGRAIYTLSKTDSSFDQIWHMPTSPELWTGKQYIERIAKAMNVPPKYYVLGRVSVRLLGLFIGYIREMNEMLYQNEYPYIFDSSKFNNAFHFKPTTYDEGIETAAKVFKKV